MRITVSRSFTYDVNDIKQQWLEIHGVVISDDDAIEYVEELAHADHGTPCKARELVFMNSDTGEEL